MNHKIINHNLQFMIRLLKTFKFTEILPFTSIFAFSGKQVLQFNYAIQTPAKAKFSSIIENVQITPSVLFNKKENQQKPDEQKKQGEKKNQQPEKEKKQKEQKDKKSQKIKKSAKNQVNNFFDNFWENQDPKDPNKKPDSKWVQLWKKFETIYDKFAVFAFQIYRQKYSISYIVAGALLISFISYNIHNEIEISQQQFFELVKTHTFTEIEFVEEEFYANQKAKSKKIEGKVGQNKYFCYVLTFDEIYDFVAQDSSIKFKNINRNGFEVMMNKFYSVIDILSTIIIIGSILKSTKKGSQMGGRMGGMQSKKFQVTKNVSVKFSDVAGMEESKRQVQQVVDFLVNPSKYHALGASIPKGVLLTGPPGTGKTLLAKACAGEAGVPFYTVSGSDFVEVFVGVGASRVRDLFSQAKQNSPSIIFIDELDAIGKKRQNKLGSNDERQSTLNQLLVEMDGFGTNSSVIVMGATNRKEILDGALVRAGRFDRQVEVGLPDLKGRYQILLVHLKPIKLSSKYTKQEYAKRIASLTPGFSGAEIANLCNQAAILAARCNKEVVQMLDFQLSSERVIGGVERKGFVSLKEKKTVAYHESGHAVVSWFLQGADPLLKVTIIPRSKGSLGFAQYFINENQLQSKEEIMDRICFILGGRCSQLFFFNEVTTGAYDDLQKAYNLAYHLVAKFGMNTQIGYISFPDIQYTKPYGQKLESSIDLQIKKIIAECTEKTKKMIIEHEIKIRRLSEELMNKETLDVRSIQKILGKRPFRVNKTFEAYLETSEQK